MKTGQGLAYGFDFGTSNSSIAVLRQGRIPELLPCGGNGVEASVLFFPGPTSKEFYVGKRALDEYLAAGRRGRFMQSIKSLLPYKSFTGTNLYGDWLSAEEIVALILRRLKEEADLAVGTSVNQVVLGRPVIFSEDPEEDSLAHKRLANAAQIAGFQRIEFQYEPIAAAYSYESRLTREELVLVADLGAGTCDFTIIKLQPAASSAERSRVILGNAGVHVGGNDFDAAIMWHKLVPYFGYGAKYDAWGKTLDLPHSVFRNLCRWEWMAFLREGRVREDLDLFLRRSDSPERIARLITLVDKDLGFGLFKAIERAKIGLTEQEAAVLDFHESGLDIHESITRDQFAKWIRQEITAVENCVLGLLEKTGVKAAQIDSVFLTGGSSKVLAIKSLFDKSFGAEKMREGETFTSVALGLALLSGELL